MYNIYTIIVYENKKNNSKDDVSLHTLTKLPS